LPEERRKKERKKKKRGDIRGDELPFQIREKKKRRRSRPGSHILFANSLNAASLSLPWMISLPDPTRRWHNTIWSSSGSWVAMEKNLAAGDGVVVSLICCNPSETKTTEANTSAAR